MGDPIDPRCRSNTGTEYRIITPDPVREPQDYPPFSVELLGLFGQAAIPDTLAYALMWQIELDRQQAAHPEPTGAQQELAEHLLAVFDFLLIQEQQAERHPADGALLYRDPLKQFAGTPLRNPRMVEVGAAQAIPLTDDRLDAPLPVWAPSVYPREFGAQSRARYPARPRALAEIPPFDSPLMLAGWLRLRDWRPPPEPPAQSLVIEPVASAGTTLAAQPRPPKPVDKKALDDMLNQAAARFEANKAAADASQPYSRTPLVNNAIRQLSSYTLADLRTTTSAKLQSPWEDDKLIEHTNVILYHSVVTMVLDKAGNPFDLRYTPDRRGLLDDAVLVPEPGSQMRRALPNPGGVTVSVQRYGDTTFRIENDKISKVLFGGVGSFREVGYGYTGKHALQETVEQFLKGAGGYIASVSAEAAFNPAEADLSRINLRLYDLAEAATPHVINEMKARLKNVVENWQEILEQGVWEAIKNVVIDEIRDRIQKYVIKKIGESIVPVVNAAFALYDLATGSAARARMRYAIACAILAVKGTTEEDTELAARVVSKVVADEFEDKIIEALINAAKHVGKKVVRRATGARPSAPAPKTPPQPQPKQRLPNRPLPSRRPRPNPHRRFTKAPPTPRHDAELTSMCARRWPKPFSLRPSSSRHPRPARRQANTMTPRRARRQTKSTAARPAPARATLESPPQKESRRKAERRKAIHRITGRRQVISRPPQ